ncbi:MAG: phosphoribosylaminoimidazolesuccinocarboxamide synthase [Candidatus Moraniibacteriota bacterium]
MAYIPEKVRATALIQKLTEAGLTHLNSGKTGELFLLPDGNLLIVKTDRLSIFDFVLKGLVPRKGEVLTRMPVEWLTRGILPTDEYAGHHLLAYGEDINQHLHRKLWSDLDLQSRSIVAKRLSTPSIECIARGYLTGTGYKAYLQSGIVCGHQLPPGMHDGSKLPRAIFAPTTKAAVGHDEHVDYLSVRISHGITPENVTLALYNAASAYALKRGIIIADTKLELGPNGEVIDEAFTPDTSRFWPEEAWKAAQAKNPPKSPIGFDKQFIREWGDAIVTPFFDKDGAQIIGIGNLDPTDANHVLFVSGIEVPDEVLEKTSGLYQQGLSMLFDVTI